MRSHYGRWYGDHWLRSFAIKGMGHKKAITASEDQVYDQIGDYLFETTNKRTAQKKLPTKALKRFRGKTKGTRAKRHGLRMKYAKSYKLFESQHSRADGREDDIAETEAEFWLQVPEGDPLRQRRDTRVDGSGSIRYQLVSIPTIKVNDNEVESPDTNGFLMSADMGVRWRPAKKYLNFVFEHRIFGSPREKKFTDILKQSRPRSMYLLIDDLPYNSYLQAGAYRFGFGSNSPDHTLLSQDILARSTIANRAYNMSYQAVSLGAAPNIPFAHLHYIYKDVSRESPTGENWTGFAGQIGAKAIRFGGSASYSFFQLAQETDNGKNQTTAHALNLGAMLKPTISGSVHRLVGQLEAVRVERERVETSISPGVFSTSTIVGVDLMAQLWREVYLHGQYSVANSNRSMQNGSSTQWRVGIKAHLLPGLELSARYGVDTEETEAFNGRAEMNTVSHSISQQIHFYF
jgi:hypothetical protein